MKQTLLAIKEFILMAVFSQVQGQVTLAWVARRVKAPTLHCKEMVSSLKPYSLTFYASLACVNKFSFLYLTVRAVGALVLLGTQYTESKYWLYILLAKIPSLLFFTAFSFFIYFFARIVMEEESDSPNLLKPFFFVFNALTYTFFFGMAIYSKLS